ncbi:MAG: hypothetical protein AB1894_15365 [Chloroflexota bacterium]
MTSTDTPIPTDHDAPIEVYFGSPALDLGIATVPKILPRFWSYLSSDGERLNDRQYALLMQVLLLRDAQEYELRVANLPMASSLITLERDKKILRRLGLVFTERLYYPTEPGRPPRMQAQRWDLRSLLFNLEQVAQLWAVRQKDLVAHWETGGRRGNRPVYNFPANFIHEVTLPAEVALDILKGIFYPVPARWEQRASTLIASLPTGLNKSGRQIEPALSHLSTGLKTSATLPTGPETSGTPTGSNKSGTPPTGLITRGHLLEDEEEEEGGPPTPDARILDYFAIRRGDPDYQPTTKEQAALHKLLADGFSYEQAIAGIDEAFARPSKPRYFTHCAAIARDLARRQQELQLPETRTQPETQTSEALTPAEESHDAAQPGEPVLVIETHLARAAKIYASADRELTPDLLARLRLMAARCDLPARAAQSTGGDWLADALSTALGVAKPGNLLNYADAVLTDWIKNGRPERQRPAKPTSKPRSRKRDEPGTHQGIREYLEKHGGIPHEPTPNSHPD